MPSRPNILFLMSDEHRPTVGGFAGDTVARTPVLDELAATGVVFRNAYTPSPICIPGRQSIMAGQFPSTTGCRGFGQDLDPGSLTFARQLARHAYETVACGKLHHLGTDQMQGWTRRIAGDMTVAPHHIQERDEDAFAAAIRPISEIKWSDAKEIARAGVGKPPYAREDELARQGALNFIEEHFSNPYYDREQRKRPVLLKLSLHQPHYPYHTTEEKFTWYLNRVQPFVDQPVSSHPALGRRRVEPGVDVSEREIRRAMAAYYGMIETVDDYAGDMLDALRHVGEDLDDWIIVYTTDHGEMLGEHGVWEKQKFYEASARVPLIIRWPKRFPGGRIVDENVNLCDLFATLCDLAGVPIPHGLDSRSMVPLMDGDASDWDNETVSQFGTEHLMIKRDSLKYQYYGSDGPDVLFDLARDPGELEDVSTEPANAEVMASFRRRAAVLGYSAAIT